MSVEIALDCLAVGFTVSLAIFTIRDILAFRRWRKHLYAQHAADLAEHRREFGGDK